MTDLRWEITQAVLREEPLQLRLSDQNGRGEHTVALALDTLGSKELDAQLMRRIGLGQTYGEAIIDRTTPGGPAARAGLLPGDRVLAVDGHSIADRSRLIELIRASGADGHPRDVQEIPRAVILWKEPQDLGVPRDRITRAFLVRMSRRSLEGEDAAV